MKTPVPMIPGGAGSGRAIAAVIAIALVVFMVSRLQPPATQSGQQR